MTEATADPAAPQPLPVVVGIDGSETSLHSARWAAHLAHTIGTSLHLVHSEVTAGSFLSDAAVVAIRAAATADQYAAAEKILKMTEETVREHFPDLAITTEVVSEAADVALIRRSRRAQFVVVGSEDVSRTAALLLGSTTLTVATRAECPVVAWRNVASPTNATVLVGVACNASDSDSAALEAAFEYARMFGAPVTAVHAWTTNMPADHAALPYLIDWDQVERSETKALAAAVQPWAARFPDVNVQCVVDLAKPSRALLDRVTNAQLVVVATRRSNALSAALLGSTTLNLLHHSPVPVMVCRAREHPEDVRGT